ncbi:MAG: hypothetical protein IKL24_07010 [Clostridia bacterium]|nr:hypothetical protein [Clostridia bacterium]
MDEKIKDGDSKPKEDPKVNKEKRSTVRTVRTNGVKLDFSANEEAQYSRYYLAVSRRYRLARYMCVLLLVAFLIVMLVFFRENITYANLMYLARDLDSDAKVNVGVYNDISYTERLAYDFGFYRQRLAVATNTGFTLYSKTGSADLETSDVMQSPRLETGEKYALVYDVGAKNYSVFTTVARVLYTEAPAEILDAAVSDSGSYALLTSSDEAKALVTVYNKDFAEVTKYYKDKFVIDIALDNEGTHVATAAVEVGASELCGEISVVEIGVKEAQNVTLPGMMPLQTEYTEDGRLVVLCDTGLVILDGAKEIARVSYDGRVPRAYCIEKNIVALAFADNVIGSENTVFVYDTSGKELYDIKINGGVDMLATDGEESIYTVSDMAAFEISLENGKQKRATVKDRPIGAVAVPGSLVVFSTEGTRSYFTD